ncbi:MAG: hypothetical protein WB820_05680 [Rhodoplanes sp.]
MRVEVETDQIHGAAIPRRFRLDAREIEVVEILDQWFGADYRYCKVKGSDGALYILQLNENRSEWSLIMLASPEAQAIAPQSGASKHT